MKKEKIKVKKSKKSKNCCRNNLKWIIMVIVGIFGLTLVFGGIAVGTSLMSHDCDNCEKAGVIILLVGIFGGMIIFIVTCIVATCMGKALYESC